MIDEVLNRWFVGEGSGLIAKDFGCGKSRIKKIVRQARSDGDPRAISHLDFKAGSNGWRQRYRTRREDGRIASWTFVR